MPQPPAADPAALLRDSAATGTPVEDWGPVWRSARFRLARSGWLANGLDPFLSADVPYAATSGGQLSADAVELAMAAHPGTKGLRVLELGSGTGVFARSFLTVLRHRAPDLWANTTYSVTDVSAEILAAQVASGVLAGHEAQVRQAVLDLDPETGGTWPGGGPFDLIVATYILDVLPFDLLVTCDDRIWRQEARGVLEGPEAARAPDLRRALDAGDPAALASLADLGPRLAIQLRHRELDPAELPARDLLPGPTFGRTLPHLHCFGAMAAIDRALAHLAPGGLMFIADYGRTTPQTEADRPGFEGYGTSIAAGLNFAALDRVLAARPGLRLHASPPDEATLHRRVLQRLPGPDIAATAETLFSPLAAEMVLVPLGAARAAAGAGRVEAARDLFAEALTAAPWNWALRREAGFFLLLSARDPQAARAMAQAALELNPVDPESWRLMAEAELAAGDVPAARAASDRAVALAPRLARPRHTAARVALAQGDPVAALRAVAEGLAGHGDGDLRQGFLEVQSQAIAALDSARTQDGHRRRNAIRMTDAPPI